MLLWQAYNGTTWIDMKTPSTYKIDYEDLDNDSYRAVATGNLIRNKVSGDWSKLGMTFNNLTASQVNVLMGILKRTPIKIKSSNPFLNSTNTPATEMECYCSKKSIEMNELHNYSMSFNLVQSKKVSGQ